MKQDEVLQTLRKEQHGLGSSHPSKGEHMKQDEALKLALDALENISTALREDDVLGSDIEMLLNAAAVIRVALAQPEQESTNWHVIDPTGNVVATEKDAIHGWARLGGFKPTLEVLLAHHESGWRVVPAPPLPVQERNFCQRCGKRTADPTTIHTCTPPIAADPKAFHGFPSGPVSTPNAGGKCVTAGETAPKEST